MTKIENKNMNESYYNSQYFEYQQSRGEFGGFVNQMIFKDHIGNDDILLDFGCGGGFLLKNLQCKKRIGIEINESAAMVARENGIEVHSSIEDIDENSVDTIISFHALEHTHNPLKEMQGLYKALKKGGKAIIVIPCESIKWKFIKDNVDQHLYTWSPMCIGNLMTLAGFNISEAKPYYYQWIVSKRPIIVKLFGWKGYHFCCKLYGYLGPIYQVKVIATK